MVGHGYPTTTFRAVFDDSNSESGIDRAQPMASIADGSTARMLADIEPGEEPSYAEDHVVLGGYAYFEAFDKANGGELWRTDGTASGTTLVASRQAASVAKRSWKSMIVTGQSERAIGAPQSAYLTETDTHYLPICLVFGPSTP
jgi:ELWxxDGT repeat protein